MEEIYHIDLEITSGLSWAIHISNAGLGKENPGTESILFKYQNTILESHEGFFTNMLLVCSLLFIVLIFQQKTLQDILLELAYLITWRTDLRLTMTNQV